MAHVQHDTTGEIKLDVGAGFPNPPWVPVSAQAASLEKNKRRKIVEIDSRTAELILDGFEFTTAPARSSKGLSTTKFSLSLESQINWINVPNVAAGLAYPYRVFDKDDRTYYDFVDATELLAAYNTAVVVKNGHLMSGSTLKQQVRDAVEQAALDLVVDNRT